MKTYECQFCKRELPLSEFVKHDFPCWKRWCRKQDKLDSLAEQR